MGKSLLGSRGARGTFSFFEENWLMCKKIGSYINYFMRKMFRVALALSAGMIMFPMLAESLQF